MNGPFPDRTAPKPVWRTCCASARRARTPQEIVAAGEDNLAHLLARCGGRGTVGLFAPLPREPLPPDAPERLAATGTRVLVPITDPDRPLDWAALPTGWSPGPFGIRTPTGPRLGPDAVRTVDLLVVPALAVDDDGFRMGRGGGFYDRTLALLDGATARPEVVAVLFDGERVPTLPRDPHDRPVDGVLTPSGGFTPRDL